MAPHGLTGRLPGRLQLGRMPALRGHGPRRVRPAAWFPGGYACLGRGRRWGAACGRARWGRPCL
eukprot:3866672-Alexandrium_andersonii.AAC.1